MGEYATTTSISLLLPGYLAGAGAGTTSSDAAGTAIFSKHIDRAESAVNACVTKLYSIPFTTVPPIIRTLTEDIASFFAIRGTASRGGQMNQYMPSYERAIETLDDIKEGKTSLALTDGSLLPRKSAKRILSNTDTYTPIFGLDDPQAWKRDKDEVDDTASGRE